MPVRVLKYLSPLLLYIAALIAFTSHGLLCYLPLLIAWVCIPIIELFLRPNEKNMNTAEEEMAKHDKLYDYILYLIVCIQLPTVFFFLNMMKDASLTTADIVGRVGSMGLLCGTFGINVGHELGHRIKPLEQWLAKISLLTSLYMHFFIEHNKGHHKNVATPNDPSSARYGEPLFLFWPRTIFYTQLSAWHIANDDMRKKQQPLFSLANEMLQMQIIQIAFVLIIYFVFGWKLTIYYLLSALIGILLLETVNYIEHYGLSRKQTDHGKYERALPQHSWNSNHVIGRLMLFELSRHSDHHYLASRKYQILRHHDGAPQMPTGYPGMMLLSLIPPLWFYVMNRRIKRYKA